MIDLEEHQLKVGTVAQSIGASLPVVASGWHALMRLEEITHVPHRLGDQIFRLLPGIQRHLCLRRQLRELHADRVRKYLSRVSTEV